MRFLPAGCRGLLVECDDTDHVVALHHALGENPPAGAVDIVPAARTVLVTFDDQATSRDRVTLHIRRLGAGAAAPATGDVVDIAVTYDGDDLAEVATLTGLSEADVIRRHVERDYVVAFCGFAPGFAYLVGADPALDVPRRTTPRTRVPAGSVALAGEFTGIYPRRGPGGWQLLGHTEASLWDLDRDPPRCSPPAPGCASPGRLRDREVIVR